MKRSVKLAACSAFLLATGAGAVSYDLMHAREISPVQFTVGFALIAAGVFALMYGVDLGPD